MQPYLISVCLLRISAFSIGVLRRSTVTNAAKLAVYDEMRIKVKNPQTVLANLVYTIKIYNRKKSSHKMLKNYY